ncbi:hypothetical protein SAMN05444972_10586 [Marininema halotolerans]|uniref:Uncharacterized protein n=1 Tax=Marininema halotolerans TaxID=1155944 RepID=A0A1I6RGY5_9BACL|nr:hypothetical protein SAMN05444972_10586 [Marininema halotolerans]
MYLIIFIVGIFLLLVVLSLFNKPSRWIERYGVSVVEGICICLLILSILLSIVFYLLK